MSNHCYVRRIEQFNKYDREILFILLFKKHRFCEICKKNKSSRVLVNNGVFVLICSECARGITIDERNKKPKKLDKKNNTPSLFD